MFRSNAINALADAIIDILDFVESENFNTFADSPSTFIFNFTDNINTYTYQLVINNKCILQELYIVNGDVQLMNHGKTKLSLPNEADDYLRSIAIEQIS